MIYSTLVLLAAAGAQAFNVPTPFASVVRTSPVRMMAVPDATVLDAAQSTIESELSVLQLQIEASKVKTQMAELRLEELVFHNARLDAVKHLGRLYNGFRRHYDRSGKDQEFTYGR